MVEKIGLARQAEGLFGQPGAMTIIMAEDLVEDICYQGSWGNDVPSMSSHEMFKASTAQASLSRTGDTNQDSFLLNLVANRSICCMCHRRLIRLKIPRWGDHSV